jgi:tetratricopeptide (TPR) repeat protein
MSRLQLPPAPQSLAGPVKAWHQPVTIDTYLPCTPDRNPMFLEKRVYQGSSGKVYPLPYYDRIETQRQPRTWQALHIENDYLRLMILPELGGRIHVMFDKLAGYDLIYRQETIKPALVGLAGPWISGGIEFNWPQHHRPATFMPTDWHLESHDDGSRTIWCSDHDPMLRMKGMHGVCLHPNRAVVELQVRLYNRTALPQTFLWWANVATRVHEQYQSFFPPDVHYVADHARRAMSRYPSCEGRYYGVDYSARKTRGIPANEQPSQFIPPGTYPANDLSWYANIPVPTSYMCLGSKHDFFGGYDHRANCGIVHLADHHISPGKKQWTWGNHLFGYCWDRHLTDPDEQGVFHPYIEIMAGVFTDNQPDFSFLLPGETKSFSQYWYPIREIGPAQQASVHAALSCGFSEDVAKIGICVTRDLPRATLIVKHREQVLHQEEMSLSVAEATWRSISLARSMRRSDVRVEVIDERGTEIVAYTPPASAEVDEPSPATEPPLPAEVASIDELYVIGVHLSQYRHATRMPELYWREALRRDPLDSRCNTAMGAWHLRRGEFSPAETHLRRAIERLTSRNPNPADGEAHYLLGETLRHLDRADDAYDALNKATWNFAWRQAALCSIAEIDATRCNWHLALQHIDQAIRLNVDHLWARNLKAIILRQLGKADEAGQLLRETLALDPLDFCARCLLGEELECDVQTRIDLALDLARARQLDEAIRLLKDAPSLSDGTAPQVQYHLAHLHHRSGDNESAAQHLQQAAKCCSDYCFPSRLEDIHVLAWAIAANPKDAKAPYYLGNLFYDRHRSTQAMALWSQSAKRDPSFATVWRNLGIGFFNIARNPAKASRAYERAMKANPADARIVYERDQLWKRLGVPAQKRLRELDRHLEQVKHRDDLSLEYCALQIQLGKASDALTTLSTRAFQPWEGGEGVALNLWYLANLVLGKESMQRRQHDVAMVHFLAALDAPANLGESRHPLANISHVHFWIAEALRSLGAPKEAREHYSTAASFRGDFQEMSVRSFSEMTYFSAMSQQRLGKSSAAMKTARELLVYAKKLEKIPAKIDYFATSLPTMLLFEDDLQKRQTTVAKFMQAQARLLLGEMARANKLLLAVRKLDPNHQLLQVLPEREEK